MLAPIGTSLHLYEIYYLMKCIYTQMRGIMVH